MSQVRKLQKGNNIPKAEGGYKFILDNQEHNVTDDQLKEIDNRLAKLDLNLRRFLGGWTSGIKSGNSIGNRIDNTVSMNMLSGIGKRDTKRLEKQKPNFLESLLPTDSYYAKQAISEALNITYSVLSNSNKKVNEDSKKSAVSKSNISLDFNEKDGKRYLSPTAEVNANAKKRVSDLFAHLQAGDKSEYDYSAYNTDAISAWLNGLNGEDKYKAGDDYFSDLWTSMGNGDHKYDPDVEDLLKMFGITYNITAPQAPVTPIAPTYKIGDKRTLDDGTVEVYTEDGTWIKVPNDPTDKTDITEIEEPIIDKEKTQESNNVSKLVLIKPGDRDDMDWGVYYNGVPYSYESIQPGSELGNLMSKFEQNNRQMWDQGKRYNENSFIQMPSIENFADWHVGQTVDTVDLTNFFLNNGITSAALSHMITDADGNKYYKYYNNFDSMGTYIPNGGNTLKRTPWGIRSPYYIKIDKNGNVKSISESEIPHNENESLINTAPNIKDVIWNPTTSFQSKYPGFYGAPDKIPATFITSVIINGKEKLLYQTKDGNFWLGDKRLEKGNFRDWRKISIEQLYKYLQRKSYNPSKNNAFKNKFGGIIKAYDGVQLQIGKQEPINDRILYGISIKRLDKNGIGKIEYYDEIPESVLRTILKFEPQSIVTQSGDLSGAKIIQTQVTQASPIKPEQQQIQVGTQPELEQSTETPIEVSTEKPTEVSSESQEPLVIGPRVVHPSFIYKPAESFEPYTLTRSPLITSDVPPIVSDVPMSKQKVVKVKTNENKNFNDLVDILESLVNKHKKGGIIKGQDGLEIDQKYIDDEFEKSWKGILASVPSTTGGGYTYNLPGIINNLIPFVSLAGFAANAGYQNKYNRQWKSAVESGRFHELPITQNTPRPDNPIYDRALQDIRSERRIGIKPYTSNWTEFNTAKQQYDANLWNRENSIIGQKSSDWSDKQNQILNIQNQNLSNFITTANSNRARDAAIESAKGQADMGLTQQRAQSLDNLLYEFKTNMAKDKQLMQAFGQRQFANSLQKSYDNLLDTTFSGARAAYLTLPAEESAKYYDLEDYIRQTRPDEWAANYETLAKEQERIADEMARWNYINGLYYSYPNIMMPRNSSIGVPLYRKKGGRLTGKTRYRYEPDEQILIDNNKAAHAAIAKLNENTIKLLLRALK